VNIRARAYDGDRGHAPECSPVASGTHTCMSDFEHELIVDLRDTRGEADQMRKLARRALVAATTAQEAAYGRHDAWIDDAMRETASTN
jgi:hypothetical protein